MKQSVLVLDSFIDRLLQAGQGTVQTVGNRQVFQVKPEALNGIEKRTVFRQTDDQNAVFVKAQSRLSSLAVVVGGVVHDQNEMAMRIDFQQVFQESDKGVAVLASGREMVALSGMPVVAAKDMEILPTARSRNELN